MAVVLALVGAAVYGVADFWGGLVSRRAQVLAVVAVSQAAGLLVLLPALLLLGGELSRGAALWGAAAGLAGGLGLIVFYRALATGPMSIVAPLTAVTAAAVPVLAGLAFGERPTSLAGIGVVLALVAVVLVSAEGGQLPAPAEILRAPATVGALAAGAAFGLFFVLLSRSDPDSGAWPLLGARAASVILAAVLALAARTSRPPRATLPLIVAAGVMDMTANLLFLLASRQGLLSVTGVLIALYPASTVLLAQTVLRERVARLQVGGLLTAGIAVALIAVG